MSVLSIVLVSVAGGLFVLAFALTPVWIILFQSYFGTKAIRRVAQSLNGHAFGKQGCGVPQIAFQHQNVRYNIQVNTSKSNTSRKLMFATASWPDYATRILVFPETFWTRAKKMIGMQDLLVGSDHFDETFILQADSQESLLQTLNAKAQGMLLKIHADERGGDLNLSICGGSITLAVETSVLDSNRMLRQIYDFVELRELLLEGAISKAAIIGSAKVEHRMATCMVCGSDVDEYRVDCKRCQTPHHKDCWGYFGGCSRYGCGEKQFDARAVKRK